MGETIRTRITVDKDKFQKTKQYSNNLTTLFNDFLDIYTQTLPTDDLLNLQVQARTIQREINEKYEELAKINLKINRSIKQLDYDLMKKQEAWVQLRTELTQRKHEQYKYTNPELIKEIENILGYSLNELIRIYEFIEIHYNDFNFAPENINKWEYVEKAWREYENDD